MFLFYKNVSTAAITSVFVPPSLFYKSQTSGIFQIPFDRILVDLDLCTALSA